MEENENVMNEEVKEEVVMEEKQESTEIAVANSSILSFSDLRANSETHMDMLTNIEDKKELYNLDNSTPDYMLNDCEGMKIRVKNVMIKKYEKPMKEPIVDEETGEIVKDTETTMAILLIDDQGKTYATGSKTFGWQLIKYLRDYDAELATGVEIEIIKKKAQNSNNKTLGFKLV